MEGHITVAGSSTINESDYDESVLDNSEYLTREELMKRRAIRLRRLAKCYRDHYWLLMEDVRNKHREFIWQFGKDSFNQDAENCQNGLVPLDSVDNRNRNHNHNHNQCSNRHDSGVDELNSNGKLGFGGGNFNSCDFPKCRSKAMAMTRYCHSHILSDSNQVLYIKCQFALKCGEEPILCGKPILRSTVPSMCTVHLKTAKQNIHRALRKHGATTAATNRLASKFHVLLTEYVRLIQSRRRAIRDNCDKTTRRL